MRYAKDFYRRTLGNAPGRNRIGKKTFKYIYIYKETEPNNNKKERHKPTLNHEHVKPNETNDSRFTEHHAF